MEKGGKIEKALQKCAVGFSAHEVVEEFVLDGDEFKLVKRKVTKRDVPPDIKAVKMLLDEPDIDGMSDEELAAERERLIKIIKENDID